MPNSGAAAPLDPPAEHPVGAPVGAPVGSVYPYNKSMRQVVLQAVSMELTRATDKFGPFRSPHEGFAIILEEVEELKYEVFHGSREKAMAEAVQVGAMAVRFVLDLDDGYYTSIGSDYHQP